MRGIFGKGMKMCAGRTATTGALTSQLENVSVVKNATGQFYVYFPPGLFSSPPWFVANHNRGNQVFCAPDYSTLSKDRVLVYLYSQAAGVAVDEGFSFIAIGH